MKNIKSGELLFALIFFITSAFLISQLPDQVKWFKNTKITSQPALWCSIGLIGMTVFGFVHLILNIRLNNLTKDLKEGFIWVRSIEFALWFLLYVVLVQYIGYLFATCIIAFCLSYRVGYQKKTMLLSSVLTALSIVLVFKTFLEVKIPGGIIYEYLPDTLRNFMILNF